tara:strand:- start:11 stop:289 length:279 start_codon:yes stop_codon:yes gene_type:complete
MGEIISLEGKEMSKEEWLNRIKRVLLGRKITIVEYMDAQTSKELAWPDASIMLHLDSGIWIYPSQDDEGNNAGSLFTSDKDLPVVPSIRIDR